ncbi:MAG: ribose-phosphate pyrophosphokinase, partial [Bacteroidetes bacterium]
MSTRPTENLLIFRFAPSYRTGTCHQGKSSPHRLKGVPQEGTIELSTRFNTGRNEKVSSPILISGNANPPLAREIAAALDLSLCKAKIRRFEDGEISVYISETVRGKNVYVIQPTCPPVNENLMELLLIIDALRRASARQITAVIPYFGYARQDR